METQVKIDGGDIVDIGGAGDIGGIEILET